MLLEPTNSIESLLITDKQYGWNPGADVAFDNIVLSTGRGYMTDIALSNFSKLTNRAPRQWVWHRDQMQTMVSPYMQRFIHDRSGVFPSSSAMVTDAPIGSIVSNPDLIAACHNRATYIRDLGQLLYIPWSGGIDSTLVLIELMKVCHSSQIIIQMNHNSITEYPLFYEKYIKGKFDTVEFSYMTGPTHDGLLVTCHSMDTLFGPVYIIHKSDEYLNERINISNMTEIQQKFIHASPTPIVTKKDFMFWAEYALLYQHEQFVSYRSSKMATVVFAAGCEFHNYAVSVPMNNKYPEGSKANFKMPLKDIIYNFTKDSVYRDTKLKVASWRAYKQESFGLIGVTATGERVYDSISV